MEKFCLRWNEFETNVRDSFRVLREDHFDVTLACDDDHQIQAHRIILSAGSQFFSDLFKKTKHTNLVIYLKGIKSKELEYVVDFLYNGETYLAQEELNKFLETAKELQVKGLQSNQEDESELNQPMNAKPGVEPIFTEIGTKYKEYEETIEQESIIDSLEQLADTFHNNDFTVVKTEEASPELITNLKLDLQIEQMIEKNEGLWQCKVCGKSSNNKYDLKAHAETHIEGVSHTCHICNKTLSTRESLRKHISNIHSESSLSCNICGKSGMNRKALMNHKHRNHKSENQKLY